MEAGDKGLTLVAEVEEGGETGLVKLERDEPRDVTLSTRRERDANSEYSVGLGFQEARWKLFFLRTLALYAARMAAVASWECKKGLVEAILGVRPADRVGDVVISKRGGWFGATESVGNGETGGEGDDDEQVS
jgi:hypothetical protein